MARKASKDGAKGRGRSVFGIRPVMLFEITSFLAVALLVDQIFFSGNRFWSIEPHPFWIVVILATVQYGTNAGVLAALLSSAALLVGNLPEPFLAGNVYAQVPVVLRNPLLWLSAAVLLGEMQARRNRELDKVRADYAALQAEQRELSRGHQALLKRKERLETRIASWPKGFAEIYRAARGLEADDLEVVLRSSLEGVRAVLQSSKASVFLVCGVRLEARRTLGWNDRENLPATYGARTPLYQALMRQKRYLTHADAEASTALGDDGLIAVPLRDPETGALLGMVKIEDLPERTCDAGRLQDLQALCDWIGTAIARVNARHAAEAAYRRALHAAPGPPTVTRRREVKSLPSPLISH